MQKKKYINFLENPTGSAYKTLIDLMFEIADTFILAERKEIVSSKNAERVLILLEPYRINSLEQYAWAGTITAGKPATVHCFSVCNKSKEIILNHSKSLYDWLLPNLPDDLSFLLNKEYLLTSTSHEFLGGIIVTNEKMIEKVFEIDYLKAELIDIYI